MKKILISSIIIFLSIGFCSVTNAAGQDINGYIYSESVGWISLNCANTNSCSVVDYKAYEDSNGLISGYGFSQDGQWINLNPNYGGANVDSNNFISGWVYSEKAEWIKIESAQIFSADDLRKESEVVKNIINKDGLSNDNTVNLLNSFCSKFLSRDECAIIK